MNNNQKKGSKGFWKKLGFVAGAIGLVAVGALAEKKFGIVDKTAELAVKGYNAAKTGVQKVFTKQPQVSNMEVDTTAPARNNNYQGNGNYPRKYNN